MLNLKFREVGRRGREVRVIVFASLAGAPYQQAGTLILRPEEADRLTAPATPVDRVKTADDEIIIRFKEN